MTTLSPSNLGRGLSVIALGAILGGCSFVGGNTTGPGYSPYLGHSGHSSHSAQYGQTAPYAQSYGQQAVYGHQASHAPQTGHSAAACALNGQCGGAYSVAPTTPSHNAYGQAHSGAAHSGAGHYGGATGYRAAAGYGLRGPQQGYKYATVGGTLFDVDDDVFGLQGRLGYQSANIIGAEVEGALGLNSAEEDIVGGTLDSQIDYQLAGFAKAALPVGQRLSVHARGGYHTTRVSLESDIGGLITEDSTNIDGLAYGAGAEFALSPRDAIRADYTIYEGDGGGNLDSVSLGYLRRF